MNHAIADGMRGKHIITSIDYRLQQKTAEVLKRHHQRLEPNKIHNMAAIIMDVKSGKVLAYIGNVEDKENRHNNRVDVVMAPRSSGSTFKPFLYASMLEEGLILPKTLVADVPVNIEGYSPKNFSGNYDGAVHADEVLYRSLNVPMVRMLKNYGLPRFHHQLKDMRFSTITRPPDHYGLSLILGGAETTLWELTGAYGSMARILNHFNESQGQYRRGDFHLPVYLRDTVVQSQVPAKVFSAAAIYNTFESLTELTRPIQESGWKQFSSSRKVAWKTGTSFGFRDAWAVGVTPQYAVGVWAGNADGEGRPGLTGVSAAAPVLMDLFRQLPSGPWFEKPWDELIEVPVCSKSGHLASENCSSVDTVLVPEKGIRSRACPYHQTIHLDEDKKRRVNASCYPLEKMNHESWFVLPPVMEWYYKRSHPEYRILPPWSNDCSSQGNDRVMQLIYPEKLSEIYIPTELDGSRGEVVFRVAHRQPQSTLFWYIDEVYCGQTKEKHQIALRPKPGNHKLTVTDEKGNSISSGFVIVEE
jgi:penicillin-binding protein 1C